MTVKVKYYIDLSLSLLSEMYIKCRNEVREGSTKAQERKIPRSRVSNAINKCGEQGFKKTVQYQ